MTSPQQTPNVAFLWPVKRASVEGLMPPSDSFPDLTPRCEGKTEHKPEAKHIIVTGLNTAVPTALNTTNRRMHAADQPLLQAGTDQQEKPAPSTHTYMTSPKHQQQKNAHACNVQS